MIDITMYSDDELSLLVDNEEYLYLLKFEDFEELLDTIKETCTYTEAQLQTLIDDYNDDN